MASAAAVAFPNVSSAETTVLKMQSSWSPSEIFHEMAQQYVERVQKMAGGRLRIDLTPAGAIVKAFEVQNACHDGTIDAAHSVSAYWYGKNRAASLFGTGPVFGADSAQLLGWMHYGGGKELYRELVQDVLGLDIVGFFCMPMPTQPLGWFTKKLEGLGDLARIKYRTVGLATELMRRLGVAPTQVPSGDIVTSMQTRRIDAFEFNNPTSDRQLGAQDVASHYVLGSYHQAVEFFEIIFNKRKFDGLADEQKAILEYAAEAANTANYGLAMDRYSKDLRALMAEDKIEVSRTPEAVLEAQLKQWDEMLKLLSRDPFFKKVVDSQKAWTERVGYYHFMNAADFRRAYTHYFPGKLPA